ncbi:MAG TPA: YbhB/YbcL family Raf kinase inhibitor-like protein [Rhodanobacteraceae bacterium]|nr:YbhB/YbcL family Raf kinase inhibitor-like protein [Rhodanobacteraceae bacterium]
MRSLIAASFVSILSSASAIAQTDAQPGESFTLESATFGSNTTLATTQIYNKGECNGGNQSPELHWKGAPGDTKSFAITMFDPDARGGAGWWHWLLYDIAPTTTTLAVGIGDPMKAPAVGISGNNSFGDSGYSGPCPPRDDKPHHYVFTIYALKVEHLGLPAGADAGAVKAALEANTLLSTTLQGQYER